MPSKPSRHPVRSIAWLTAAQRRAVGVWCAALLVALVGSTFAASASANFVVKGTITGDSSSRIAEASVALYSCEEGEIPNEHVAPPWSGETDANGSYKIEIEGGPGLKLTLCAGATAGTPIGATKGLNYNPTWYGETESPALATRFLAAGEGEATINITLRDGGQVAGTLLDPVTHAPIAGSLVRVSYPTHVSEAISHTETASDGTYRFWGFRGEKVVLCFQALIGRYEPPCDEVQTVPGATVTLNPVPSAGGSGGGGTGGGSSGGGSSSGGSSSSAGSGTPPGPTETATVAHIEALLDSSIPTGRAASIRSILSRGGYSVSVTAPEAGALVVDWYEIRAGGAAAHDLAASHARKSLVGAGKLSFSAAGTGRLVIWLTAAGRRLLRHSRHLSLTETSSFTPIGKTAIAKQRRFTLKR